jgi:hypothetical protein
MVIPGGSEDTDEASVACWDSESAVSAVDSAVEFNLLDRLTGHLGVSAASVSGAGVLIVHPGYSFSIDSISSVLGVVTSRCGVSLSTVYVPV